MLLKPDRAPSRRRQPASRHACRGARVLPLICPPRAAERAPVTSRPLTGDTSTNTRPRCTSRRKPSQRACPPHAEHAARAQEPPEEKSQADGHAPPSAPRPDCHLWSPLLEASRELANSLFTRIKPVFQEDENHTGCVTNCFQSKWKTDNKSRFLLTEQETGG